MLPSLNLFITTLINPSRSDKAFVKSVSTIVERFWNFWLSLSKSPSSHLKLVTLIVPSYHIVSAGGGAVVAVGVVIVAKIVEEGVVVVLYNGDKGAVVVEEIPWIRKNMIKKGNVLLVHEMCKLIARI